MDGTEILFPKLPESLRPRMVKTMEKLDAGEITEEQIVDLLRECLRSVIAVMLDDPKALRSFNRHIPKLVGKSFFRQPVGLRPTIIEVRPLPEVLDLRLSTEEEVRGARLPGIVLKRPGSKEILAHGANPVSSAARKRTRVVRVTRFFPWGIKLLRTFEPLLGRGGEDLRERILRSLVPVLDKGLKGFGC